MTRISQVLVLCIVLLALAPCVAMAQEGVARGPVYVSPPVVPTLSPAVRDLPDLPPNPNMFGLEMKRREEYGFIAPYYEGPHRLDPLVELQSMAPGPVPEAFGTPVHNYTGMTSPSSPPDTTGDVGPTYFLQGINGNGTYSNSTVGVFNKSTGANAKTFELDSLASSAPCNSGYCDPIVLYDRMADRWIVTEFPSSGGHLCVYVSTTADPTGTWYAYYFANVETSTPDYPKYGVWPQNGNAGSYMIGINAGASGVHDVVALDRAKMLAGLPATYQKFSVPNEPNFGFQLVLPAHLNSKVAPPNGSPAIVMRPRDDEAQDGASTPTYDLMEMWAVSVDWNTPADSTITQLTSLHIADYDCSMCGLSGTWNCMPQAGTTQRIDPIREPLHWPLVYRNFGDHETLVGCFVEDVDGTDHGALRWFEFRKSGGNWSVYQEGVVGGEANVHRSVGSVTMDGSGNMAIGYTRTGDSLYPSIYYKGRLSTDPLGTMPQGEYVVVDATTSKTGNERWGDYSGIGIDPADDCTFWYTTEYGGSGQTKIAAVKFDACGFAGSVALDKDFYACSGTITITVSDASLIGNTTQNVDIWSTRETTHETVTLTATPPGSATFVGTITISSAAPVHGDGLLSVAHGNTITVEYIDADDGAGGHNIVRQDTATVDCQGPVITNVLVTNITDAGATITWTTDESANSRVTYGTSTPPGTNKDDLATYVTSHSVNITGLATCTKYYFSVTSSDVAANSTTDTNGGTYYSFTTAGRTFAMGPDNVEGGVLSWVATGTAGALWHQDTCQSHSATHAWKAGAAQGTCPGTYVATADTYLTWNANINLGAAGHGLHLYFWEAYTTESGYDYCHPQVSTDGGTTWVDLASYAGTGAWAQKDYDLAAYTGATVRIRFWFHSDGSVNYEGWYVDDISVSKSQACSADPRYQSLSRTDVCGAGGAGNNNGILDPGEDSVVTITMVNGGMAAATTVSATLSTSTPGITVTDNSATFPNIAANGGTGVSQPNHYSVHVDSGIACGTVANFTLHAVCTEVPSGVDSGFTMTVGQAGGTITDMSQDFTSVTPPALPAGWTVSHTSGNDWLTSASYYCNAANGLYYPYNSSQAANSWAYTPSMTLTAGVTYTLNFNQKVQSATFPEALEVKAGTAATPAGQTIMIWTQTGLVNTTCTARAPTFTVPSTGTYYLSFHCTSAADEYYLIVDDISLTHVQAASCTVCTCTAPGAPNLTAATGDCSGVNLTWTAGTGTTNSYNAYRSTNTTCPVGTLTKLNASPIPSGTLSYADTTAVAGTTYTYVVRGACDAGGTTESVNSNCRAAARLAVPAAPAAPTFTGVGQTSITVNWGAVGGATNYDVWRQTGASCAGASKITASPVAGLSYADNTVTCGNTYSYFVTANNACGASANGACNTQATSACASAPKPVPDGRLSGTAMKGTRVAVDGSSLNCTYDTSTCSVPDHTIIYGTLGNVSTVTPSGGVCSIGNASPYSWTSVPAGNIWWVIVGDGGTTESSWGQKYVGGSYSERSASASNQCGNTTLNTSGTCP